MNRLLLLSIAVVGLGAAQLVEQAAAQNACYNYCYDRRADQANRARQAEQDRRRADEQFRRADQAYRAARAADQYVMPYAMNRVVPGGALAYRGTRELMDSPARPIPRHVTPFQDCQQFPSVAGALNCGPAAPPRRR